MKKYFIILTAVVVLLFTSLACTSSTSSITPAPMGTSTVTATSTSVPLSLTISEPQNESIVRESLLRVSGHTAPDAILSINGDMVRTIDENGNFTTVISLVEGPNLIDAIATNYEGDQVSQELTVIYLP